MSDGDAQLMLRFKAGDRAAFEELFGRYSRPVVNFLTRMVRDRARAEELAQEVFVRIYQAGGRYEQKARFTTWMFGIAHNLALNELDRAYHKRERSLDEVGPDPRMDEAPGADEQVDARRLQQALEVAIDRLPERQRAALVLRTQEGLGYGEIADALGTSSASVKSLLHRARESLLVLLKGDAK